jgi:hypothetical protein
MPDAVEQQQIPTCSLIPDIDNDIKQKEPPLKPEALHRSASTRTPAQEKQRKGRNISSEGLHSRSTTLPYMASRAELAPQEAEYVRRQGNDAFTKGQYSKSVDYYTKVTPFEI